VLSPGTQLTLPGVHTHAPQSPLAAVQLCPDVHVVVAP
jgi:hypothetical protein